MKFKIFSKYEKCYKFATCFLVLVVTAFVIYRYVAAVNKSDTFIEATLYAVFLFVVGLFLSHRDKQIGDKIYERKNYYCTLLRLKDFFQGSNLDFLNDYSAKSTVIAFQVSSGRSKEASKDVRKKAVLQTIPLENLMIQNSQVQTERKYYISENGFVFTEKLQTIEDDYLDFSSELQQKLTNSINEYIRGNNVNLGVNGFSELSLLYTNYEMWCDEYITDEDDNKKESVKKFIYGKIESLQADFDSLELKKDKVEAYYRKCHKKVQQNIKRMESTYGDRLQHLIRSKDEIISMLSSIEERLGTIEKNQFDIEQCDYTSEKLSDCNESINQLHMKLEDATSNIIDVINMLRSDIEDSNIDL